MRIYKILILTSVLLFATACTAAPTEVSEELDSANANENGAPTQGIQDHQLYFAVSEDGEEWHLSPEETILEMASVPNLVLVKQDIGDFKKGTLLSHFVDSSEMHDWGEERIGYISSEDNGASWSERKMITIENMPEGLTAVDPCVVQLGDGRMRIYFFDFTANKNLMSGEPTEPTFYSAVSEDGLTFEFEGEVYSSDAALITDPELIWYGERWLLYNPVFETAEDMMAGQNKIQVSESSDGTNFELITTIDFQGIPGVMHENGIVSMFGCSRNGITRVQSEDGIEFDLENPDIILKSGGCDPDPAKLSDGTYGLILKGFKSGNKKSEETVEAEESEESDESDESMIPIIDTHAHIYPVSEELNSEYIDDIVKVAEENGVSGIVLGLNARHELDSPPKFSSEHDDWVLAEAKRYPEMIIPALNGFDPEDPDAVEYVRDQLRSKKWKMIGELDLRNSAKKTSIAANGEVMMDIFELAGKYEVPVMIHYDFGYGTDREDGIAELEEALDENSDTIFIYAHSCGPDIITLMESHGNLYCEQGLGTTGNGLDTSRVVIGTDIQVHRNDPDEVAEEYKQLIEKVRAAISSWSEDEQEKAAYETANDLFNL